MNLRTAYIVIITAALIGVVALSVTYDKADSEISVETPDVLVEDDVSASDSVVSVRSIGASVLGRPIEVHEFGAASADTYLLFVGGIHGGYEWNSVLLAYELIDHLRANLDTVPENVQIGIVPSANPDGVYEVIGVEGRFTLANVPEGAGAGGHGRFNANDVDLNRNFACKWQPESSWRGETVSAGTHAFSEPEAAAIRNLVVETSPDAAIFWHSQANTVYASECEDGVLPETVTLMNTYGKAAGYNTVESFDAYPITGDVEGWLASIGIPAITVELATHEDVEWERNLPAIEAVIEGYAQNSTATQK